MALISNGTTVASGGNVQAPTLTGNLPAISGASLTGISVTPTSAQVASATASISAGAVGSYVAGHRFVNRTDNLGATESGSSMYACNFSGGYNESSTLSGTWRLMGYRNYNSNANEPQSSLWLRIS